MSSPGTHDIIVKSEVIGRNIPLLLKWPGIKLGFGWGEIQIFSACFIELVVQPLLGAKLQMKSHASLV